MLLIAAAGPHRVLLRVRPWLGQRVVLLAGKPAVLLLALLLVLLVMLVVVLLLLMVLQRCLRRLRALLADGLLAVLLAHNLPVLGPTLVRRWLRFRPPPPPSCGLLMLCLLLLLLLLLMLQRQLLLLILLLGVGVPLRCAAALRAGRSSSQGAACCARVPGPAGAAPCPCVVLQPCQRCRKHGHQSRFMVPQRALALCLQGRVEGLPHIALAYAGAARRANALGSPRRGPSSYTGEVAMLNS